MTQKEMVQALSGMHQYGGKNSRPFTWTKAAKVIKKEENKGMFQFTNFQSRTFLTSSVQDSNLLRYYALSAAKELSAFRRSRIK